LSAFGSASKSSNSCVACLRIDSTLPPGSAFRNLGDISPRINTEQLSRGSVKMDSRGTNSPQSSNTIHPGTSPIAPKCPAPMAREKLAKNALPIFAKLSISFSIRDDKTPCAPCHRRPKLLRHLRRYGCVLKREGKEPSLWENPQTRSRRARSTPRARISSRNASAVTCQFPSRVSKCGLP